LKDDGEQHGGGSGAGGHEVVALPPLLLGAPELTLGFHLLDAPFCFACTA
jgi:hypothetical protein